MSRFFRASQSDYTTLQRNPPSPGGNSDALRDACCVVVWVVRLDSCSRLYMMHWLHCSECRILDVARVVVDVCYFGV